MLPLSSVDKSLVWLQVITFRLMQTTPAVVEIYFLNCDSWCRITIGIVIGNAYKCITLHAPQFCKSASWRASYDSCMLGTLKGIVSGRWKGLVSDALSTQQTICPILQYMQGWTASVSKAAQDKRMWAPLFSSQFTTSLWRANTCTLKVAFIFVLAKNLKATSHFTFMHSHRQLFSNSSKLKLFEPAQVWAGFCFSPAAV